MNRYFQSTSTFMGKQLPCVRDSDGDIVAAGLTSEDAALFATAPQILAVLQEMLQDAETMKEPYRNEAICERARAVIAEANLFQL